MKRAFLSALLISSALPAYAADIVVTPIGGGDQMITIEGQIGPDDFDTFQRKASGLTGRVAVHLRGPGGNLISALRIGEFIRFKAWATAVGSECDSSCAAIWLAGVPRLMFPNARIGFHAASINGQERGNGNALFGAYMNRLGLSYGAVLWATTAAPSDIAYLTPAKANELGIDAVVLHPDGRQTNYATAEPVTPPPLEITPRPVTPQPANPTPRIAISDLQVRDMALREHAIQKTYDGKVHYCPDWTNGCYDSRKGLISKTFDGTITNNNPSVTITRLLFEISLKDESTDRLVGQVTAWAGSCGEFSVPPKQVKSFTTCRFDFANLPMDKPISALLIGWRIKQINLDTMVQMDPVFPNGSLKLDASEGTDYVTRQVWDRYIASTGRYITRTLQACTHCGKPSYRLIAKDHDANGGSNGGSTCFFDGTGWSDCIGTAGNHYRLNQNSIKLFLNIANGAAPGP